LPRLSAVASADGQDEQPLPLLTRSDVCGFKQDRSRHVVPCPSQIRCNPCTHVVENSWDVFEEHEAGPVSVDCLERDRPEVALVFRAFPFAGNGMRLAGDAAEQDANSSWSDFAKVSANVWAAQGSKVRPDSSFMKVFRRHARDQDRGGADFALDVQDAASLWKHSADGSVESADAAAYADGT